MSWTFNFFQYFFNKMWNTKRNKNNNNWGLVWSQVYTKLDECKHQDHIIQINRETENEKKTRLDISSLYTREKKRERAVEGYIPLRYAWPPVAPDLRYRYKTTLFLSFFLWCVCVEIFIPILYTHTLIAKSLQEFKWSFSALINFFFIAIKWLRKIKRIIFIANDSISNYFLLNTECLLFRTFWNCKIFWFGKKTW